MPATLAASARQTLNEYRLGLLRLTGARARSYADWQAVGRQVRYGERLRSFQVTTDDGRVWVCYGFGESQLYPEDGR